MERWFLRSDFQFLYLKPEGEPEQAEEPEQERGTCEAWTPLRFSQKGGWKENSTHLTVH